MFRSGGLLAAFKMGADLGERINQIYAPLGPQRSENTRVRKFMYLFIIGVLPRFQGFGHGKRLLNHLLENCEQKNLPVYLEAASQENVQMYRYFGFRELRQTTLPLVNIPVWEMIREPKAGN